MSNYGVAAMSQTIESRYEFENRPAAITAPPRNSKHGQVVAEVGVFEDGTGTKNYWKVFQRIEDREKVTIRPGYYAGSGDNWGWAQDALLLPASIYNELQSQAVTEGILVD